MRDWTESFNKNAAAAADGLTILVVMSLPWSTSATSILVVLWFVALLPSLKFSDLKQQCATLAGGAPLLLVGIAVLSVLWADVSFFGRLDALRPLLKLIAIPLLLVQFRNSVNARLVIGGYLISCTVLLATSLVSISFPIAAWSWGFKYPGVAVKDAIAQSAEFAACGFALLLWSGKTWEQRRLTRTFILALWAALFFGAILYVATSRTELIVMATLLVLVFERRFGWKGVPIGIGLAAFVFATAWVTSPYLRARVNHVTWELQQYFQNNAPTSSGIRLEFWRKSADIIRTAPVIGHGVGTTKSLMAAQTVGTSGATAAVTDNPHNQILAIGIEMGLVGIAALFVMWFAHARLFYASAGIPWLGLLVVVQNAIGSLFNSHLYDFTQGWTYVFGVGVLGGMALSPTNNEAGVATDRLRLWLSDLADALARPTGTMAFVAFILLCIITFVQFKTNSTLNRVLDFEVASSRLQLRAFVVFDEGYVTNVDGAYKVIAEMRNDGRTPALNVTRWIGAAVVPDKGSIEKLKLQDTNKSSIDIAINIAPNGKLDLAEGHNDVVPKEISKGVEEGNDLYILGLLKYVDVYSRCQYSGFVAYAAPADSTGRRKLIVRQPRASVPEGLACNIEGKADYP